MMWVTYLTFVETAMGIQVNAMTQEKNEYVDAIYGVCEEILHRVTRIWLHPDFIYYRTSRGKKNLQHLSVLHGTTNRVIHERKHVLHHTHNENKEMHNQFGTKERKAFLDLLIEASGDGTILTHQQIREEVDTFLFEGHDTTTASICWTIFLLGLHPEIQERVYNEVSEILGEKSLELSDLGELNYLERVIKESLRLYPSVGFITRFASQDIKIGTRTIPTGTSVGIHIFDIHRNEKYYPEPNKFDPDRFLPENTKSRHPYAYIPFSAGPRNCIGQKFALYEEKTVLSYIIKKYKIKSMQTVDTIHPINELIVRPSEGLMVTLEKRTI
ncbi:cytochrome p450 family 4 [Holotrichia oblita]|uniref:Cytochrome p450 family 4 n=1 Tax=Holotrichia oblita TaxID=644536 RepID=A0ACB9TNK7_HOLOL|nr:cytochrome p450 family 4 [Holotrichia oblita]